jgi:exodeoxyribonuclease VII large subunit
MELPERKIFTVSEFTDSIKNLLEKQYPSVWIQGEISNFKAAPSGHYYFTLKDANAQIRCVMFRIQGRFLKFKPQDGVNVIAWGRLSVYPARGDYQLILDTMEPAGLGSLMLGLELLKRKLEAEGVFDPSRKRPVPRFPVRVGLVTSPRGAAVRDMIRIIKRRSPATHILLSPASVQGDRAPDEIVTALTRLCQAGGVDAIIIGRGGGSIEDLWAFNDEGVVRAVAACPIPIISAVGHETDVTLTDFAADLRASTPSAAAELVVPDRKDLSELTSLLVGRLEHAMHGGLDRRSLERDELLQRLQDPRRMIRERRLQTDDLSSRLVNVLNRSLAARRREAEEMEKRLRPEHLRRGLVSARDTLDALLIRLGRAASGPTKDAKTSLQNLASRLNAISPLAVLARGYSITFDPATGRVISDAEEVEVGADVSVHLCCGQLACRVIGRDT